MYTGSFQFTQLEHSPHVRTAGRAFFHGSWGRPPAPDDDDASSSDSSASDERDFESDGKGSETSDSGEDSEERGPDEEEAGGGEGEGEDEAMVKEKGGPKRRIAWGWPKAKKSKRVGEAGCGGQDSDEGKTRGSDDSINRGGDVGDGSKSGRGGAGWRGGTGQQHTKRGDDKKMLQLNKRKGNKKMKRIKRKKKRKIENRKSQPHGEGYVEFLDGWGVSQVRGSLRMLWTI